MTDFYDKYQDLFQEEWIEFEGAKFKLRSNEHPKVVTASVKYQELADNKDILEYLAKLYSESLVVDWENVSWKSEELPFSVENAYMLFSKVPAIVLHMFNNYKGYQPIDLETEEKKS